MFLPWTCHTFKTLANGPTCKQTSLRCVSLKLVPTILPQNHGSWYNRRGQSPTTRKAHHNKQDGISNSCTLNAHLHARWHILFFYNFNLILYSFNENPNLFFFFFFAYIYFCEKKINSGKKSHNLMNTYFLYIYGKIIWTKNNNINYIIF